MKKVIITGITGQDGAYLAKFLLEKGYKVYGTFRRLSTPNFWRLNHLNILNDVGLIPADLLDQSSILEAVKKIKPDEVYNLAAQSFVGASFEQPVATGEITGLGLTRVLDVIRTTNRKIKFYQASTSEMFGGCSENEPLNEYSRFRPNSPYAAAKLYAHWVTVNYRKAYKLFACSGILFNHESPIRGLDFVTRKITYNLALIKLGIQQFLYLGNLDSCRDWGFAGDYVEAMWLMLQQDEPEDFVIATGTSHSVRDFGIKAAALLDLDFEKVVKIDKKYFRPTDVNNLLGDPQKAIKKLGWEPNKTSYTKLVSMMVESDLKLAKSQKEGYSLNEIDSIVKYTSTS